MANPPKKSKPAEVDPMLKKIAPGVYETPMGSRVILRRLTPDEEMEFYKGLDTPRSMTVHRPK